MRRTKIEKTDQTRLILPREREKNPKKTIRRDGPRLSDAVSVCVIVMGRACVETFDVDSDDQCDAMIFVSLRTRFYQKNYKRPLREAHRIVVDHHATEMTSTTEHTTRNLS